MSARITWAVLAPLPAPQLERRAERLWREMGGLPGDPDYPWEVIAGSGAYSALVDHEPGSEGRDEDVAESLSREVTEPVYLMRLREDEEVVWELERGRVTQQLSELPYAVATRLDCPLPGAPVYRAAPAARSLCVVEGADPEAVAHALGFDRPPSGPMYVMSGRVGALVYSERGSMAAFLYDLSAAFPGPVYLLVAGSSPGRFVCGIVQG